MTTYRVNVIRDGRWWMIEVPALDGHVGADGAINVGTLTQARHYRDIEKEARDFICTVVDAAPSAVEVDVHVAVDGLDVGRAATEIATDKKTAKALTDRAIARSAEVAVTLNAVGVAMREIGEILGGITHQRVEQLISGIPTDEAADNEEKIAAARARTAGSWAAVPDSLVYEDQSDRTVITEADEIWRDPVRRFECIRCGRHYACRYPGDTGHCNGCADDLGITSSLPRDSRGMPVYPSGMRGPVSVPRVP